MKPLTVKFMVPEHIQSQLHVYHKVFVGCLIQDPKERLLLIQRSSKTSKSGVWEVPYNRLEKFESIEEGCRRAVFMKTSLKVNRILEFVQAKTFEFEDQRCITLNILLTCSGDIRLSKEHCDYIWWDTAYNSSKLESYLNELGFNV